MVNWVNEYENFMEQDRWLRNKTWRINTHERFGTWEWWLSEQQWGSANKRADLNNKIGVLAEKDGLSNKNGDQLG